MVVESKQSSTNRPRYDSMRSQSSIAPSAWGVRPPSPTFSTTTTGSKVNLPAAHTLITRKDLRQSIACFEDLMAAAKAYRNALLAMSSATAALATAMEACSRVKGCRNANSGLAGSAGLQYLVSNHEQILADTVYRQFEIPLLEALDNYKMMTAERLALYEKGLHEQSGRIRKTEAENLKGGRRRKRDLQQFRLALAELQRQVDELDSIKAGYHEEVLEGEDEVWDMVLSKVAFVVRSQLDFYEKISGKASDPILEPMVMAIPDPFDTYGPPKEEGHIFSVLAPLSQLNSSPQTPNPNLTRTNSSPAFSTPEQDTPSKPGIPFPVDAISPVHAETSSITAMGLSGSLGGESGGSRARRELSVIEERDAASISVGDAKIEQDVREECVGEEEDTQGVTREDTEVLVGDQQLPAVDDTDEGSHLTATSIDIVNNDLEATDRGDQGIEDNGEQVIKDDGHSDSDGGDGIGPDRKKAAPA